MYDGYACYLFKLSSISLVERRFWPWYLTSAMALTVSWAADLLALHCGRVECQRRRSNVVLHARELWVSREALSCLITGHGFTISVLYYSRLGMRLVAIYCMYSVGGDVEQYFALIGAGLCVAYAVRREASLRLDCFVCR